MMVAPIVITVRMRQKKSRTDSRTPAKPQAPTSPRSRTIAS